MERSSWANSCTRWKPPANAPQHHVTVCSQLISSAHAWMLNCCRTHLVMMHPCRGVTLGQWHPPLCHSLLGLLQYRGGGLMPDAFSKVDESLNTFERAEVYGQRSERCTGSKRDVMATLRALPRYLWAWYQTTKCSERPQQWAMRWGLSQGVPCIKCSWDWEIAGSGFFFF